jgi:hypothetical protein
MLRGMFMRYLWWSVEILFYLPPFCFVTPFIVVGVVVSIFIQKPFGREIWNRRYPIAILQFACYPATLLVAAIGAVNGPEPSQWGFRATYALALLSLGIGIYWVCLMRELRWYATSVVVLQLWLLAGANLIAGMALTGRWL